MTNNNVYVEVVLEKDESKFDVKILSFKRLKHYSEVMNNNETELVVTTKDLDDKHLIPVENFMVKEANRIFIIELTVDSYGKFVYLSKMPDGFFLATI